MLLENNIILAVRQKQEHILIQAPTQPLLQLWGHANRQNPRVKPVFIIERGDVRWITHNTSTLQPCPQSPWWLALNKYKQVATSARCTKYLLHLESVAFHMWRHAQNARLPQFTSLALHMPGPSLSIMTHVKLQKVLQCFTDVDITAYTFLTLLLNEPTYNDHPCTKDLLGNSSNLFATFLKHPKSSDKTWAI